jgi:flagellar biosynthesis GTPase FlhF
MEASTSTDSDVKTFRGRSLEEILPQIREELGPDAIVLRRREGLTGGVGGFFQRPYIEVDARGPLPTGGDVAPTLDIRSDRATAEGLSSPAVQALFEQATPFADALAAAARARPQDDFFASTLSDAAAPEAPRAEPPGFEEDRFDGDGAGSAPAPGLYGPQPNQDAIRRAAPTPSPADLHDDLDGGLSSLEAFAQAQAKPEPVVAPEREPEPPAAIVAPHEEPEPDEEELDGFDIPAVEVPAAKASAPLLPDRPAGADAAEKRLVAAGLSEALAADVVREAVVHGLPFAAPKNLKRLVRSALARRIEVLSHLTTEPRTLALVGGGGAGKTSTVAAVAAAYVAVGADVAVVALRGDTALAGRLQPLGVAVIQAADGAQAKQRLGHAKPLLTLIDTPAVGLSSTAADVRTLADELRLLGAAEVHLALPATLSAGAAREIADALRPLGATHVVLSHADETKRPGAPIELALTLGRPLSYVCAREGVIPADPAALAQQLLP